MRRAALLCTAAVLFGFAASAMSLSGGWTSGFSLSPSGVHASTVVTLTSTTASWGFSSITVLADGNLQSQALTFRQELGDLALSGGVVFSPTHSVTGAPPRQGQGGLRWDGMELTTWDLTMELSLGRLTLKLTLTQSANHD